MSRKSLADRIRESGENTQTELDKSRQLADRIAFSGKKSAENVSDKVSGNVTDKVSGNLSDKVSGNLSDTVVKSVVKSLVKPVVKSVIKSQDNQQEKNDLSAGSDTVLEPDFSHKGIALSENQFAVYRFLSEHETDGFTQATNISYNTGINIHTVRKILIFLKKKDIIKYQRYQKNGRKGIIYNLNPDVKIDPCFNIENMLPAKESVCNVTCSLRKFN